MAGAIIGYDLNESYCQISYYSDEQQEPVTLDSISLAMDKQENIWQLAKFVEESLHRFPEIAQITFTVPALDVETVQ